MDDMVHADISIETLSQLLKPNSFRVFNDASKNCKKLSKITNDLVNTYLKSIEFDPSLVSFIAVGSVGRDEALSSSDLDLIPVLKDKNCLHQFKDHDKILRKLLRKKLELKVSRGEELTKFIDIDELTSSESIGGPNDSSDALTKRILILLEGKQIGGSFSITDIRNRILASYAGQDRTSGRHVLSLCNDLARYYRTLCIEYKAKVEHDANWCTRNLKLRHSRKLWYFSSLISIVILAEKHPRGNDDYTQALLELFDDSPVIRLTKSLYDSQPVELARLLESYSVFLEFMSRQDNRDALIKIEHGKRYELKYDNPFPAMKYNSDIFHQHMITVMDGLNPINRKRIIDWFLL